MSSGCISLALFALIGEMLVISRHYQEISGVPAYCLDQSAMEDFFSSLKTERLARKTFRTRDKIRGELFVLHRAHLKSRSPTFQIGLRQPHRP
jgi:hypothetical protein